MTNLPHINDFAGTWTMSREIEDRRAGQGGTLEGMATIEAGGLENGFIYRETGKLVLEGAGEMEAVRIYLWGPHARGIAVHFQDGRDFHVIELDRYMPDAQHHCAPDMYHVSYNFTNWPAWTSTWRVQGPRKDYRMVTRYSRA